MVGGTCCRCGSYECTKALIGAFNGAAVGVGATLDLAEDIRWASTKARFGFVLTVCITIEACQLFCPRLVAS